MVEEIIHDLCRVGKLRSVALRYFNAAGASSDGSIGESHDPETHLIPNILRSISEPSMQLKVFGGDYPTLDGTCVRDYIHVEDLARAHLLTLDWMNNHEGFEVFNLGHGRGFSVKQVIEAAGRVSGHEVFYSLENRRSGDPAVLVASAEKARRKLGWAPEFVSIDQIIESAWRWHRAPRF